MTDQLRETFTRIADQIEPTPADPTLWSRARRSRRRSDLVTASAVGAAALALVATVGVLVQPAPDRREPAPADREGIPSIVRGVIGDGGLPLETDLAVGAASVAVANPAGAFVVTADDGAYHRLDLPGFDPAVYDDPGVRRTGMVGLSLSPDGLRLAYGWHAPLPEETGQEHGFVRSGVRILDLDTGRVETLVGNRPMGPSNQYYLTTNDFLWAVVPYGIRWSPGGRYLGYQQAWHVASTAGAPDPLTRADLRRPPGWFGSSAPTVVDTTGAEEFRLRRIGDYLSWESGWPSLVTDSGILVRGGSDLGFARSGDPVRSWPLSGSGAPGDIFNPGLSDGSRVLLETRAQSSHLLSVDLRSGAIERLRLDLTPVRVDLLGWIDRRHALAQVQRGEEAHLTVLDLSGTEVTSNLAATIEAAGTDSTFSVATDFATVEHPTRDFSEAEEGDVTSAAAPPPGAVDAEPGVTWWLAGLAAGIVAAGLAALVLRRRIRVD